MVPALWDNILRAANLCHFYGFKELRLGKERSRPAQTDFVWFFCRCQFNVVCIVKFGTIIIFTYDIELKHSNKQENQLKSDTMGH